MTERDYYWFSYGNATHFVDERICSTLGKKSVYARAAWRRGFVDAVQSGADKPFQTDSVLFQLYSRGILSSWNSGVDMKYKTKIAKCLLC